jgi:hypothetical protein
MMDVLPVAVLTGRGVGVLRPPFFLYLKNADAKHRLWVRGWFSTNGESETYDEHPLTRIALRFAACDSTSSRMRGNRVCGSQRYPACYFCSSSSFSEPGTM